MDETATATPWYRQFWCWFVLAPPMLAVVLGLHLVAISVIQSDSLVIDDYGTVGRVIHKGYERERKAADMQINGHLVIDRELGLFTLRLDGMAEPPQTLLLTLAHPTHNERDLVLELQRDVIGLYRADAHQRVEGRYYLRLEAADRSWLLTRTLDHTSSELPLVATPREG